MRTEPAWTSYPFQAAMSWIATFLIVAIVAVVANCTASPAHADGLTLDAGIGLAIFQKTSQDGLWHQQAFPNGWDLHDQAFKIGLSYEWEHWGLSASYVGLGSIKVKAAGFVGDEHYDPISHVCTASCDKLSWLEASDAVRAYQITGKHIGHYGKLAPYVEVGLAMLTHRFTVINGKDSQQLYGRVPATVIGAGACYGEGLQACVESSYYNQIKGVEWFGNPMYPLFENALVSLFTLKIPLGGA